jgi:hypothetical protein
VVPGALAAADEAAVGAYNLIVASLERGQHRIAVGRLVGYIENCLVRHSISAFFLDEARELPDVVINEAEKDRLRNTICLMAEYGAEG